MQVLKFEQPKEAYQKIRENRKESAFFREVSAIIYREKRGFKNVVTARTYATGKRTYVCLWVYAYDSLTAPILSVGAGAHDPGGYGYNKEGAAAQTAINLAGFTLSNDVEATGIPEAVEAIAQYLYPNTPVYIHIAHA